jgi:hypothetical protein
MLTVKSSHAFDDWAFSQAHSLPLSELRGAHIAVEATYYLEQLLTQRGSKEPLPAAVGGPPFSLQNNINKDLDAFKAAEIVPTFFFSGLDVAAKDNYGEEYTASMNARRDAWSLYDQAIPQKANAAVEAFGNSGQ